MSIAITIICLYLLIKLSEILEPYAKLLPEPFRSVVGVLIPQGRKLAKVTLLRAIAEDAVTSAHDYREEQLEAGNNFTGYQALERATKRIIDAGIEKSEKYTLEEAQDAARAAYQRLYGELPNPPAPLIFG